MYWSGDCIECPHKHTEYIHPIQYIAQKITQKSFLDPPQLSTVVDLERREVRIGATEDKTHAVNVSMCLKSERAGICKVRLLVFSNSFC